jgi:hypothetical protein
VLESSLRVCVDDRIGLSVSNPQQEGTAIMSLIIRYNEHGESCPMFQCDACGRILENRIDDLERSYVVFGSGDGSPGSVEPIKILCKKCDTRRNAEGYPMSQSLEVVLGFLLVNCGVTDQKSLSKVIKAATEMHLLGRQMQPRRADSDRE